MSAAPPLVAGAVALLACPVCAAPLTALPDASGLACPAGHRFDRARHGQITLLPPGHRPPSGAGLELVEEGDVDPVAGVHDDVGGLDRGPQRMR